MVTDIQREVSKMAYMISKTIIITAKILVEINQEIGELRTTVLKNYIDYLLFKHNLGCQQFPGICCFNVSDFSN